MPEPIEAFTFRGWTLKSVELTADSVVLSFYDKEHKPRKFEIYHRQDCCESNDLTDVIFSGRVNQLFGRLLTVAEQEYTQAGPRPCNSESYTWSHYKFGTDYAFVDIWFLGESNGYYGETTDIDEIT